MGKLRKLMSKLKREREKKRLQCVHYNYDDEECKECLLDEFLKPERREVQIYIGKGKTCKHGLSLDMICVQCEVKKIEDIKRKNAEIEKTRLQKIYGSNLSVYSSNDYEFEGWQYY